MSAAKSSPDAHPFGMISPGDTPQAMALLGEIGQYTPSVSKSCSRCRARKVKCDLIVPRCSACKKQGEPCNITDYVAYSYALVERLHSRIQELESKLDSQASNNNIPDQVPNAPVRLDPTTYPRPPDVSEKLPWSADVSKEAEEVGVLAIGFEDRYSQNKYLGAAAGSSFARIFFKQVGLDPTSESDHGTLESQDDPPDNTASIPSRAIAGYLLSVYIARVHLWCPFMRLAYIRSCFRRIYQVPRECSGFEKFIVFIVLALGSDEAGDNKEYSSMLDFNSSREYFQTALHFFTKFREHPRDLPGLQAVILLTIRMINSPSCNHSNDLWHLTRYCMSIALELGVHRYNPSWNFSPEELELRTRTWWTVYSLERYVALSTGRVLSVRDHCIDTPIPTTSPIDQLTPLEAKSAPMFHSNSVWLFTHMIELRKICGRVLESIYIARGPKGRCSSITFQEICAISDELHQRLDRWKTQLDAAGLGPSLEYKQMLIEYYMVLLNLNRPSPSFMIPSQNMIAICSHASSSALQQWAAISADEGILVICRCYRHFHDILLTGLVRLYCDWHMCKIAQTSTNPMLAPTLHHQDANICQDLLDRGITSLQNPSLSKFRDLFAALRTKIYTSATSISAVDNQRTIPPPQMTNAPFFSNPADVMEGVDSTADPSMMFSGPDGLESYLSQVSTIFDDQMINIDDTLTAWYGSVLDDMGGSDHLRTAHMVS